MRKILLFICVFIFIKTTKAQISYTWNGSVSIAATNPANWSPNGIPGPTDNATIVTGTNICALNINASIANLTVTSGTLDLGGYTLTINGSNAIFTSGTVQNGTLTVSGATTTTFGNGTVTMNCIVNVTSAAVTFRNTTFQQTVNITKTGASNDASSGNNIFNGPVIMTNAGSGYLMLGNGNPDQFNNTSTFNNTGSNNIYVAYNSSNNIFGGIATFNNSPTANTLIYVSQNSAGTLFNNNIVVTSNNGQGVQFCNNASATATLASGKTILVGAGGFSTGTLLLKQFTQAGATPQSITLTGSATANFIATTFNGTLAVNSPNIFTSNSIYNNATVLTKTDGTSSNATTGGNTFNSTLTVNYTSVTGNGYWSFGNGAPDIYNGDVYSNNNSLDRIIFGHNSANNQFNGNFIITQIGSSAGTALTWNASSSCVMAAGKSISIGGGGFNSGYFYIQGFTQNGTSPINLITTGNSAIYVGAGASNNPSVIGGSFTVTAADIYLRGGTFNSAVSITKTGGIYNHNSGYQNIFNGPLTINQQSNSGYFMLGYNSNDLFNDNITVTSTGSGGICFGWNNGTGTPTLAAGKTISIGGAGYSAGNLQFGGFIQLGSASQNFNLTGTSYFTVVNPGTPSTFGGALSVTAPDIYIQGGVFNGASTFTKTGGTSNHNNGFQNTFNAPLTINQQSNTGYFMLGYNSNDLFNDNIILTSSGTGGILLGYATGTGNPTLASGKTILIGGSGFSAGYLQLNKFTQLGNTAMNLAFTGTNTSVIFAYNSVIGGNLVISSPDFYFNGCTFNGSVDATKTGATGDYSQGGNIFNGLCNITNNSAGYMVLGSTNPDICNKDITFTNNGSERILPAYSSAGNQFNGNILVNTTGSAQGIYFCGGNSTATATLATGKTIQAGVTGLNAGYLILRQFTQLGNTPVNLTLTSTATTLQFGPGSAIGGNLTSSSPGLLFNGCTFSGTVTSAKIGAGNDASGGNNIFNGAVTMTNAGSGYLMFGNGNADQFNAASTFNNTGSDNIYVAHNSSNNIFGGVATFNNTPSANTGIYVSRNSVSTIFNDNIAVTSNNGQGVQFCNNNGTASASLAAGKTISVGAGGFSAGTLLLMQFTQVGSTAQSLSLTGSGNLTFGPSSAFGGNVTSISPSLYLNGCIFSGNVNLTKTGTTNDQSQGNNIFNNTGIFTNAGSGYLMLGNGNADQFKAAATFNNTGSNNIYVAYNSSNNIFAGVATFNNTPTANTTIYVSWYSTGTIFNDNIVVSSTNGQGVQFCGGNVTASATLIAGKTINVGAGGFSAGTLLLGQFTQVGSTSQNLSLTGSGSLVFGPSSAFGGNVVSVSPSLYFNGCIFSGAVNSTKTGTASNSGSGNNVFNDVSVFTNSGSGQLYFGNGNSDQFNAASTFNNTGSSYIYVAYNSSNNIFGGIATFNNTPTANTSILVSQYSVGTVFNSNIVVTSNNGQGVQFCSGNGSATATLAAGKTISVGAGGFSAGTLLLRQFTQVGATPQSLTLTGSGNLTFGPNSAFGGNVISSSPSLYFNGCNFSGTVNSAKTGTTSDASSGNNVFNNVSVFTNSGSGQLYFGNGNSDQFNAASTFNNTGSSYIYVAYNSSNNIFGGVATFNNTPTANTYILVSSYSAGTVFNSNIVVTSNNGQGVQFCSGNGSATATLAAGKTISVGAGGFSAGTLLLRQFTQVGAIPQSLALTGSGNLTFGPISAFGGNVTTSSPALSFNGCSFSGSVNSTKTGATNDQSQGNNTFNGASTFTNNGTGYLLMTISSPDTYNSDVNFVKNNSGLIYPNYNNNSTYSGNMTISSSTAVTFGANSGTATFNGSGLQNINVVAGTPTLVFTRLVINNSGSGVTLNNTSINVSNNLVLSSGLLNTTTTNILTMLNGSAVASGDATSTSYVNGPMNYQKSGAGASVLNFPIGNSPDCRPVVLTVNHSNGSLYTYQAKLYNADARALGYALPITVDRVSGIHYYTISRTDASGNNQPVAGLSGNQTIQIFFGNNDIVVDGGKLTIVKNTYTTPTSWIDIGGTGGPVYAFGSNLLGSITSTSSPSSFNSFSTFAIADDMAGQNVLPIQVVNFNARLVNNNSVDLTWTTKTETNNDYFTIEKSKDAVHFEFFQNINTEALNGNSTNALNYIVHDANPYNGTTYYRLKQTDLRGAIKYWNIVSVNLNQKQSLSVYPNPTTDVIFINGLSPNDDNLKIEWYDMSGRLLEYKNVSSPGGIARIDVQLSDGVYILRYISSDGIIHQQRVIIRK